MIGKYLKTDFYRLVRSSQFYIAVGGVLIVYLISTLQSMETGNVVEMFWIVKFYSFIICLFAASSFAFSNSLLEDVEHKFCDMAVMRGDCKSYVWAKVICCFFASMLAILLGTLIYAVLLRFRLPFFASQDDLMITSMIREVDIFGNMVTEGGFIFYFFCSGIMIGLLGGMLSLVSMWLSLIAKNKMFAICFPVFGYYLSVNYLSDLFGSEFIFTDINGIYLYSCYVFEDAPVLSFLYAVFLAIVVSIVLERLIYRRVCQIWR